MEFYSNSIFYQVSVIHSDYVEVTKSSWHRSVFFDEQLHHSMLSRGKTSNKYFVLCSININLEHRSTFRPAVKCYHPFQIVQVLSCSIIGIYPNIHSRLTCPGRRWLSGQPPIDNQWENVKSSEFHVFIMIQCSIIDRWKDSTDHQRVPAGRRDSGILSKVYQPTY